MCGIWALLSKYKCYDPEFYNSFMQLKHRGPDKSTFLEINSPFNICLKLGFHRLSIMDTSTKGDQPFIYENGDSTIYTICNGEIYNYKNLIKSHNLNVKSSSDCEVIPLLYIKFGEQKLISEILGEYAFILFDINKITGDIKLICGRDQIGIRPLFYSIDNDKCIFSSELKGLVKLSENIKVFPPGHYIKVQYIHQNNEIDILYDFFQFYSYEPSRTICDNVEFIKDNLFKILVDSVVCRLQSDRPMGCLLSGGLDSSTVAAIASNWLKQKSMKKLKTFCIGMEGSTDIEYAKEVAQHIDSEHTTVLFTEQEGLDAIEQVIYAIESYDITTIRASVGQFLISKYISENTDIKVLNLGEGPDEQGGYIMFHNAPSCYEGKKECIKLLKEIHMYDVLRADRAVSFFGLEARVPFLDRRFIDYHMSLNPHLIMPRTLMIPNNVQVDEKYKNIKYEKPLLREMILRTNLIPLNVNLRKKEAFSDGVSSLNKSWFEIIQEYVETKISDEEFLLEAPKYEHNKPMTKEAYYYRKIFEKYYGKKNDKIIPHYWLQSWCDTNEPSARKLSIYDKNN